MSLAAAIQVALAQHKRRPGLQASGGFRDPSRSGPTSFSGISDASDVSRGFGPGDPSDASRIGNFGRVTTPVNRADVNMERAATLEELIAQRQPQRSAPSRWLR